MKMRPKSKQVSEWVCWLPKAADGELMKSCLIAAVEKVPGENKVT